METGFGWLGFGFGFGLLTSSEVELMETLALYIHPAKSGDLLTSSEVELMETKTLLVTLLCNRRLLTSSEVELMETFQPRAQRAPQVFLF